MKKWLISLFVLIVLFFAGAYFFVPRQFNLSSIAYIKCTPEGAFRVLSDDSKRGKWWPSHDTLTFLLTKKMYNSFAIAIRQGYTVIDSKMNLIPLSVDSLALQWQCNLPAAGNLFTRTVQYSRALALKKEMDVAISHLKAFLENQENIYGFVIQKISEIDTSLLTIKTMMSVYPATPDVYRLIDTLKTYIAAHQAHQPGPAIMNVTKLGDGQYQLMVAVPTDRVLPGNNKDIFFRKMLPILFVVGEVKGGDKTVVQAFDQMNNYFQDYKRTAMAIPFAALITDRIKEPDTTKWLTRIYAPVYPF